MGNNSVVVQEILDSINKDLNTAKALGLLQKAIKERTITYEEVIDLDKIFGLGIEQGVKKYAQNNSLETNSMV